MRMYAMVSDQGTACNETALCSEHYTPENKAEIEAEYCHGISDEPISGSWVDCTGNDYLMCRECGVC